MLVNAVTARALDGDPSVGVGHTEVYCEVFFDLDVLEEEDREPLLEALKDKAAEMARLLAGDPKVLVMTEVIYEGAGVPNGDEDEED